MSLFNDGIQFNNETSHILRNKKKEEKMREWS